MAFVDGVEPERYLGQLDSYWISVYPIDAIVSKVSLHLLLFKQVIIMPDDPPGLALFTFQIRIGQLIHGFVQEGSASKRGLADIQV